MKSTLPRFFHSSSQAAITPPARRRCRCRPSLPFRSPVSRRRKRPGARGLPGLGGRWSGARARLRHRRLAAVLLSPPSPPSRCQPPQARPRPLRRRRWRLPAASSTGRSRMTAATRTCRSCWRCRRRVSEERPLGVPVAPGPAAGRPRLARPRRTRVRAAGPARGLGPAVRRWVGGVRSVWCPFQCVGKSSEYCRRAGLQVPHVL